MTIPTLDALPPEFDRDFWRLRTRLLKRANGAPLSPLALDEAERSLEQAAHWTASGREESAGGEHRRAERMRLIADFETRSPAFRAQVLRLRADELQRHGQADTAGALAAEAACIIREHLPRLSREALKAHNASNVIEFAEASLKADPTGTNAKQIRELIASAERSLRNSATRQEP